MARKRKQRKEQGHDEGVEETTTVRVDILNDIRGALKELKKTLALIHKADERAADIAYEQTMHIESAITEIEEITYLLPYLHRRAR